MQIGASLNGRKTKRKGGLSLCFACWLSLFYTSAGANPQGISAGEDIRTDSGAVEGVKVDTVPSSEQATKIEAADQAVTGDGLDQRSNADGYSLAHVKRPLYTPLVERFLLDEVKSIRTDMQAMRAELIEKVVDKELAVADKSMSYATGAVTYFFYLIAGISTLLVLLGWNSIRDIKQRMRDFAENEVTRIAEKYEIRLQNIEEELNKKSRKIYHAQKEIDRTNELHSLWLKASLETIPQNKIAIYDQILALKPDDIEALTYKADAALLLGEATWAISLCNRALEQEENNSHAFYQRACAYAETDYIQEALRDLEKAISISEAFRDAAPKDESFKPLWENEAFQRLTKINSTGED